MTNLALFSENIPPEPLSPVVLRDYQIAAIELARQSIRDGLKRPVLALPTGAGKTIIAASIMKSCQDSGKRGFFFMDRIVLIEQTIQTFQRFGIDFGVKQAGHYLTRPSAPIQIASIQTIAASAGKHGKRLPEFDLAIIDEAHFQHEIIKRLMLTYSNLPFIGLTATPYAKGMGERWNNLIVPLTAKDLLNDGSLCPVTYYVGASIDRSKLRSNDANTINNQDLERASDDAADMLTGDVIKNWLKYGEDSQTIAFSPTKMLSKGLVKRFNDAGITAQHIDCDYEQEQRQELFDAHDAGEFKVLSCSRLLNTGYDSPTTRCVIDCFPTKSLTTWVQRAGRIMRTAPGKVSAIYLDHAGNWPIFGPAEDIVPEYLDDGKGKHNEKKQAKKEDKKEPRIKECPGCSQAFIGITCKACGYTLPISDIAEDDGTDLVEAVSDDDKAVRKLNKSMSMDDKAQFYGELKLYAKRSGFKQGFAANKYREKMGVWPNKVKDVVVSDISAETKKWLVHSQIKYAKSKKKPNK